MGKHIDVATFVCTKRICKPALVAVSLLGGYTLASGATWELQTAKWYGLNGGPIVSGSESVFDVLASTELRSSETPFVYAGATARPQPAVLT